MESIQWLEAEGQLKALEKRDGQGLKTYSAGFPCARGIVLHPDPHMTAG